MITLTKSLLSDVFSCLFRLLDHIGAGEFGDVFKGEWEREDGESLEVAVKTVKPGLMEDEGRAALLQEVALLAQFKNDNIISLHGVCIFEKVRNNVQFAMQIENEGTYNLDVIHISDSLNS